jgi:predicted nucleic acid-binding protein
MRVFIDTNILISASLRSEVTPYQACVKAVTHPNHGMVCDQNIDELRRVTTGNFLTKYKRSNAFWRLRLGL